MTRFISERLEPAGDFVDARALGSGQPPLPRRFRWRDTELVVRDVVRSWRTTKNDRGDDYLARQWFEIRADDGRTAIVYFDFKARGRAPRWWLFSLLETQHAHEGKDDERDEHADGQ